MIARRARVVAAVDINYHPDWELHAAKAPQTFASAQDTASVLHGKTIIEGFEDWQSIFANTQALVEITRCGNGHESMRPNRRQACH
jgi:hypothetical protein